MNNKDDKDGKKIYIPFEIAADGSHLDLRGTSLPRAGSAVGKVHFLGFWGWEWGAWYAIVLLRLVPVSIHKKGKVCRAHQGHTISSLLFNYYKKSLR